MDVDRTYGGTLTWRIELFDGATAPDYLFLDGSGNKIIIDPSISSSARHDFVRIIADIGGYFEVS